MSIQIRADNPLEERLRTLANSHPTDFPNPNINYFDRYVEIKRHLAQTYYQSTATGLARSGHRFTKHDISHVDDVIRQAGYLLGASKAAPQPIHNIISYELFCLLFAILLHDAGNAHERAGHEARVFDILTQMGDLNPLSTIETHLVTSIAQAHGGRTSTGSKDTIPHLIKETISEIDGFEVHGRRLAAIVRLADELSETSRRADTIALKEPYDPPESYLPNFYCTIISTHVDAVGGSISLKYALQKNNLIDLYPDPENNNTPTFVVDYIAKRVQKCDQERRYCNRFLAGFASFDQMKIALEVFEHSKQLETLIVDLSDVGYPEVRRTVRDREARFDGAVLRDLYHDTATRCG